MATTTDILRHMLTRAGLSMRAASIALHKYPSYMATAIGRGSSPTLPTFARIAHTCGYEIHIIGHDEDITLSEVD